MQCSVDKGHDIISTYNVIENKRVIRHCLVSCKFICFLSSEFNGDNP